VLQALQGKAQDPGLSPEQRRLAQNLVRSQKAVLKLRVKALAYEADKKLH